jgi:hypothetical protein
LSTGLATSEVLLHFQFAAPTNKKSIRTIEEFKKGGETAYGLATSNNNFLQLPMFENFKILS